MRQGVLVGDFMGSGRALVVAMLVGLRRVRVIPSKDIYTQRFMRREAMGYMGGGCSSDFVEGAGRWLW